MMSEEDLWYPHGEVCLLLGRAPKGYQTIGELEMERESRMNEERHKLQALLPVTRQQSYVTQPSSSTQSGYSTQPNCTPLRGVQESILGQ